MKLYSLYKLHKRCLSSSFSIILPKTGFSQRVEPSERFQHDSDIYSKANFEKHYEHQQRCNKGAEYILHDGPPYANGQLHLGHAVNKILKDIACRYKSLLGFRVNFIPGWDCHGLPIEMKAISKGETLDPVDIREAARRYASRTVNDQMQTFKSWGIMANWEKETYRTLDIDYVITQLQAFSDLNEKGFIFQDYKPVYWSPSNRTALAEAELEYNDFHESFAVYVKFPVISGNFPVKLDSLSALIWTTTPWTLPANQAICFSPKLKYVIVSKRGENDGMIVSADSIQLLQKSFNCNLDIICQIDLNCGNIRYSNPLVDRGGVFLPGDHVTADKGTGLVHSAPNHGNDDYLNSLKHGLELDVCLVDEQGRFNENLKSFQGLDVLTDGTREVIKRLKTLKMFVHEETFIHSYPYDWRSKQPVILRSSRQWFLELTALRHRAIEVLENEVKMIPDAPKKMFINQLKNRPQWCISRQRSWGVPIPVYYAGLEAKTSKHFVNRVCEAMKEYGTDIWYRPDALEILQLSKDHQLGMDIMDIWLDSGLSWKSVLKDKQADLYLEGGDQVRGWFQSSLLTSVALSGRAPFKKVFLHGFTLDSKGRKMSKSMGNVVNPSDITHGKKSYGVDVLRWWVAAHASTSESSLVANHVFDECSRNVSKIRNTYKFLLGNLSNFTKENVLEYSQLLALDKVFLHKLFEFAVDIEKRYEEMQYAGVTQQILYFIGNDVSSEYIHAVKRRLYCCPEKSIERRSACTTLMHLLNALARQTAPILPHLASEALLEVHVKLFQDEIARCSEAWQCENLKKIYDKLLKCKEMLNKTAGTSTKSKIIVLHFKELEELDMIKEFQEESFSKHSSLVDIFQCSAVLLTNSKPTGSYIEVSPTLSLEIFETKDHKCPRCRRVVSEKKDELCLFCSSVVSLADKPEHSGVFN